MDRYIDSGAAYSAAKGLDLDWCRSVDNGLPSPDCVIYLDIHPEIASRRKGYGEERHEVVEFQKKVRLNFLALKEKDEQSGRVPWFVLDATKGINELQKEIRAIVARVIEESKTKPLLPFKA